MDQWTNMICDTNIKQTFYFVRKKKHKEEEKLTLSAWSPWQFIALVSRNTSDVSLLLITSIYFNETVYLYCDFIRILLSKFGVCTKLFPFAWHTYSNVPNVVYSSRKNNKIKSSPYIVHTHHTYRVRWWLLRVRYKNTSGQPPNHHP